MNQLKTASWADEVDDEDVEQDYSPTGDGQVKRAPSPSYLPQDNDVATENSPPTTTAPEATKAPEAKQQPQVPQPRITNLQAVNACNSEMMADNIWTDLNNALGLKQTGCILKYDIKDSWTSEITGDRLYYTGFIRSKGFLKYYEQMRPLCKGNLRFITSQKGAEFHL